jgi:CysZ protein
MDVWMRALKDFKKGISYIFKGVGFFFANRDLWKYIAIPYLINAVIFAVSIVLLYYYLDDMTVFFREKLGLEYLTYAGIAWYAKIWTFLLNLLIGILQFLMGFIAVIVAGILFFVLSQIIASPFYDPFCERIEEKYTKGKIEEISVWQAIKNVPSIIFTEIQKMLILILVPLMLLFLNLVPAVGNMVYIILVAFFTSASYAAGFVDYVQAVKNESFASRLTFAKRNFFLMAGFGLPVFIPIVNLFLTPLMVTGGTLIYIDRKKKKKNAGSC